METINLFGSGGHALVISDLVRANGGNIGVYYDDNPRKESIDGVKVVGSDKFDSGNALIIAVGSNCARKAISEKYDARFATVVHPSAIVSPSVTIGEGTVVMQGAVIQAAAKIGRHTIVNTAVSIDHECSLGDYVHVSPNATLCGNVHVGDMSWVGAGAVLIPGVRVGKNCIVGAGSVVNHDIPDNCTAVGNPARIIKHG